MSRKSTTTQPLTLQTLYIVHVGGKRGFRRSFIVNDKMYFRFAGSDLGGVKRFE